MHLAPSFTSLCWLLLHRSRRLPSTDDSLRESLGCRLESGKGCFKRQHPILRAGCMQQQLHMFRRCISCPWQVQRQPLLQMFQIRQLNFARKAMPLS